MIDPEKTYVVMGLLSANSIAYSVGKALEKLGGHVIYTVQNPILKKRYLDGAKDISEEEKAALDIRFCDVTQDEEIRNVFADLRDLGGVVHSVAYANPAECLGEEFHTEAVEDIQRSYLVSSVSLARVTAHAAPRMQGGGAVVAMTFDSSRAFPFYNWMGVHKAALEGVVRALARRHGREGIRVNAVSAGPLKTEASMRIPGFEELLDWWDTSSPLPWDPVDDRNAVADAVVFLLSRYARRITGQTLMVDGGASAVGGQLLPFERP